MADEKNTTKASYIGSPACFKLEAACQLLTKAFNKDGYGCYVVGSAIQRPDWRDVDVRFILSDEGFSNLFPGVDVKSGRWEFDARWIIMCVSISGWLKEQTGLPIDFQFQPQTHANARHKGVRHAIGAE